MSRFRSLCLGLLLIGSAFAVPDNYESNPFLHGFANDVNAFIQDQKRLVAVDSQANAFSDHSVANRAIDDYSAPTYLPPFERKLICSGSQVCVSRYLCAGGYFTAPVAVTTQECSNPDNEVCCNYRPPPPPPPPKPTTPPAILCSGRFEACVPPQSCINGVWQSNGYNQRIPAYAQRCYAPEICCRIPEPESTSLTNTGYVVHVPHTPLVIPTQRPFIPSTQAPIYLPPDRIAQPSVIRGEELLSQPINPPPKNYIEDQIASIPVTCAAALNCTEPQYCTSTGVISKTPVVLTKEQELFRVPLTDCQEPVKGYIGKCCRDPDYVDPWPVSQLGQYNDPKLFGDDGQYRPSAVAAVPQIASRPVILANPSQNIVYQGQYSEPVRAIVAAPVYQSQLSLPIAGPIGVCGSRNVNAQPSGPGPYDAAFSEYPWQAMVLVESTKSILCGGVIIADDAVATSADCVQGRQAYDVLIKAGEWKLGRDEEPLKFQLARASKIVIHPSNGMAIIYLDSKLKFDRHIAPICLDASDATPADNCVTTGWGKPAISVHAQDAIMHHSPISIVAPNDCARQADGYRYGPGSVCGRPNIDACELDSGSALACLNPQGQYVMKGIYLSSSPCGTQNPLIAFGKPDIAWLKGSQPSVSNDYLPPRH